MTAAKLNEQMRRLLADAKPVGGNNGIKTLSVSQYNFPATAAAGKLPVVDQNQSLPDQEEQSGSLQAPDINTFSVTPVVIINNQNRYGDLVLPTDGSDRSTVTITIEFDDVPQAQNYRVYMVAA